MLNILVTTVLRGRSDRNNGMVYEIDWERKCIVHRQMVQSPELVDLGPRGGARGARGIVSRNGYHYVATFNTIVVFNENWQKLGEISHPLFNGLHEIDVDTAGIWVTSTGIDTVLKVDWSGNLLYSFFLGDLKESVLSPEHQITRSIDLGNDYHRTLFSNKQLLTHVNSVKLYEGRPYIGFNKYGTIVGLDPVEIFVNPMAQSGFHNGQRISEELFVANSSFDSTLIGYEAATGEKCFEYDWPVDFSGPDQHKGDLLKRIFAPATAQSPLARPGWTRGLAVIDWSRIFIGLAPAMIVELNIAEKRIVDLFQISDNVCEAIHGLTIIN